MVREIIATALGILLAALLLAFLHKSVPGLFPFAQA